MVKLCINSRDELRLIDLDDVIYLRASGSYTDIHYCNGQIRSESQCLSFYESLIAEQYQSSANPFYRLGRSHLININQIVSVSMQRSQGTFCREGLQTLTLSKGMLRTLKEYIASEMSAKK